MKADISLDAAYAAFNCAFEAFKVVVAERDDARARVAELEYGYRVHGCYLPPEGIDIHDLTREQAIGLALSMQQTQIPNLRARVAELERLLEAVRQAGGIVDSTADGVVLDTPRQQP